MQIEQMAMMMFSKQTYQKETLLFWGPPFVFKCQWLLNLLPYTAMTSDCPQSQRRHSTKGHKLNPSYVMLPAGCLLSPSWEDWRPQANISSSTATLSAAAACLALFSEEEGHMDQIEGEAEVKCWLPLPWSWDSTSHHPSLPQLSQILH